ncbi:RNA polymerase sigma factor [soil metagenome]
MIRSPSPAGAVPAGEPSDEELVERVRVGDPDAFDTLVRRHLDRAYRIAFRLLGHREDAEDLVQESFLAVLEKVGTFRTGLRFAPWFNRIVVNRALNVRESRKIRQTDQIPVSTAAEGRSPAQLTEEAELRERIEAALGDLPERQRAIVTLFELEGFSGAEIAEILNIAAGTVRWHLHEARRALREALAPLGKKEDR